MNAKKQLLSMRLPDGYRRDWFVETVHQVEREAVVAWLDSPDAERRLAAALDKVDVNIIAHENPEYVTSTDEAKAILAALRETP